jgi:deoxyuridine 5'-triphosphate nucleotidohydrolase
MFVKYKLLTDLQGNRGMEPTIGSDDAAGADLYLPVDIVILGHEHLTIPLLIAFDIPIDWCLYLQPRSSTFTKHGLLSTTGVIDSDYHGTVHAQLYNMDSRDKTLRKGIRLVQVQLFQKQRIQFEHLAFGVSFTKSSRKSEIGSTGV